MSDDNKRLFFLQLPHDFFGSRRIKKLRKLPDGDTLVLLYLKIQLSTLNTGGVIELSGLEEDPADEIALEISEDSDLVRIVLDYMLKHGMAIQQEDGNYFLPFVEIMTTSHTEAAERMRRSRKSRKEEKDAANVTDSEQCSNNVTPVLHENDENANSGVTSGEQCYDRIKSIEYRAVEQRAESKDTEVNVAPTIQPTAHIDGGGRAAGAVKPVVKRKDVESVKDAWNTLCLTDVVQINPKTERGRQTRERIQEFGVETVLKAIENVRNSGFLCGKNKKNWSATFDWFIAPDNFQKVLEGNYEAMLNEPKPSTIQPQKPLTPEEWDKVLDSI